MTPLFPGLPSVRARALYLGERIDVRALESTQRIATAPLVIAAGADASGKTGVAVVFRYGAVVLFNVAPLEEVNLLEQLKRFVGDPLQKPETEEIELRIASDKADSLEGGVLHFPEFSVERIQIIAEILGRSVALASYETVVRASFVAIEGWARGLQQSGSEKKFEHQLKSHLGTTLLIQHNMAGRIEIGDKPDLLWERPDLERIYVRLEDEYELKEREKTLERKLALMTSTAEMLLDFMATKHSNRLEWYVIGLILFEIILSLFQMFVGLPH